jgi:hypothetical protein
MNPKSVNDLDPKLKETYERVMGTSLGANPTESAAPTMETQPVTQPEPQAQPEAPAPAPTVENSSSQVFRADNTTASVETATVNPPSKDAKPAKADGKKLLPVIIAVGAIVFFAIYALLWAKLLGLF